MFSIQNFSQSFDDLSNVNFSELNDSEIDLLLRRAGSQGYNQFDLLKMARAQGFTQADIENLCSLKRRSFNIIKKGSTCI